MPDLLTAFDELTAVTARHRKNRVTNAVIENNAALRYMKKQDNIKVKGGSEIVEAVGLVENSTITNIAGFQTAATNYDNNLQACRVPWASKWMSVSCPGDLLRKNQGKEAFVDLVNAKVDIAEDSAANYIAAEIHGDASVDQSLFGFQLWLQASGLGIAGGLDAGVYSNWANKVHQFSGTALSDTTGLTARADFNKAWIKVVFDREKPNVVLTTHDIYNVYEASVQQQMRYMDMKSAETGVESVMYKSAPVVFDVNANFAANAEKAMMLNTKHWYLFEHPEAQWKKEEKRKPVNADAIVIPFLWMGNVLNKQRRTNCLLKP